jgi:hypothetical protein
VMAHRQANDKTIYLKCWIVHHQKDGPLCSPSKDWSNMPSQDLQRQTTVCLSFRRCQVMNNTDKRSDCVQTAS